MSVTSLSRWSGGNRDLVIANVNKAKPIVEKEGAEAIRVGQIHTGPYAGQWMTAVAYPDWATLGKAQQALASNATYQKILADGGLHLEGRTIIAGIDL